MPTAHGTKITLSLERDASAESTATRKIFKLRQPDYKALILHPSLGSPLIVDNPKILTLYLVTDRTFRQTFVDGSRGRGDKYGEGGDNIKLVIAQCLKVLSWDEAGKAMKNPGRVEKLLYPEPKAAFSGISCTYLGELGQELKDRQGRHFANIRPSAIDQFKNFRLNSGDPAGLERPTGDDGLNYVFQVDLEGLEEIHPGVLYDAFWAVRNQKPAATDCDQSFLDVQDRVVRNFVSQKYYRKGAGKEDCAGQDGPLYAYKMESGACLFEEDRSVPVMQRHPIYVPAAGKKNLNLGHIADLHISSRQHAFKDKKATVIPGVADSTASKSIGAMVGNNFENCLELMNRFGLDTRIDLLILGGDLYDHLHNFDPAAKETPTTGKLWEAMYFQNEKDILARKEEYPFGIDALIAYSLVMHYYNSYQKPLIMVSGNHEPYEFPYGISPRYGVNFNEGIPLDHNLTVYEAILLYGPGYDAILPHPGNYLIPTIVAQPRNFKQRNFDWFYTLFTPLSDSIVTYGQQTIVNLEWGDGETLFASAVTGGGTLPRAGDSLNQRQLALMESALQRNKDINILSTHFTLVNYELGQPLNAEGTVGIKPGDFDHGAHLNSRGALFANYFSPEKQAFSHTLAGHSHRAGLYSCTDRFLLPAVTKGYHPEKANLTAFKTKTKIMVSASAGCMAKQNYEGELSGQGMDYPSGTWITFDDGEEKIGLHKVTEKHRLQAKPRFAVVCDYIDLMKDGFWEHFQAVNESGEFELKIHREKIHPNLTKEAGMNLIRGITLWLVGDQNESFAGKVVNDDFSGNSIRIKFEPGLKRKLRPNSQDAFAAFFLSIVFNKSVLEVFTGFDHYDYASPWNIQVGIYRGGKDITNHNAYSIGSVLDGKESDRLEIARHKKFGEVPCFDWRAEQWPNEFNHCLKKS